MQNRESLGDKILEISLMLGYDLGKIYRKQLKKQMFFGLHMWIGTASLKKKNCTSLADLYQHTM